MPSLPRAVGRWPLEPAPDLRALLSIIHSRAIGPVYLVGGAVRDLLRNGTPRDLDIAVDGDARALATAVASALGGHAFTLDDGRSQVRVTLEDGPVSDIDFAPLTSSLDADLRSRDLTVDALAMPIRAGGELKDVIDPTGGLADLEAGTLRMTSEAVYSADPLRLLRAVRLATELEFEIEPATAAAISSNAPRLDQAAPERRRDELTRIMATPRSAAAVRLLDRLGLLDQLLPELAPGRGVEQPPTHHYYDVFDHSIETLADLDAMLSIDEPSDAWHRELRAAFRWGMTGYPLDEYLNGAAGGSSRRVLLKFAGLLHDVAKPETKTVEADGRVRFFGHSELGARKSELICRRLRFGSRETKFVAQLVDDHLRPTQLSPRHGTPPTRHALYRFFRDLDDAAPACLFLYLADGAAAAGPRLTMDRWQRMVVYVAYVLAEYDKLKQGLPPAKRLVNGNDLMEALSLTPGPQLGELLRAVEEAVGAGEIETREQAIDYARRRLADNMARQGALS
jgi:poly(A) polymerase